MHARILEAIQKLVDRGQIANVVTLKATFDQDPALVENGGARYLAQLAAAGAQTAAFEDYARLVYDLWQRRQLLAIAEDIQRAAYSAELNDPAAAQIERAETQLYQLAENGDAGSGFRPLAEVTRRTIEIAEAAYKRGAQIVGVPTGFVDLDKSLGGLHRSDLVILAGRTSMGKSALAVDIALNAAKNGDVVGVLHLRWLTCSSAAACSAARAVSRLTGCDAPISTSSISIACSKPKGKRTTYRCSLTTRPDTQSRHCVRAPDA